MKYPGVIALAVLLSAGLPGLAVDPPPELQPRIEAAFKAWKQAATEQEKAEVRRQFGPFDAEFQKWLSVWGEAAQKQGNFPASVERFQFCAQESEVLSDWFHVSICIQLIGGTERLQGKYPEAEGHYKLALEYSRRPGAERRTPLVMNNLSGVYAGQARYPEAVEILNQVLDFNRKAGLQDDPAPYQNLAIVHALRGDNVSSLGSFMKALAIYEKLGDNKKLGLTHYNLGVLHLKQGNHDAAGHEFVESMALSEKAGDRTQLCLTLGDLGRVRDLEGHAEEALRLITRAVELSRELGYRAAYNDALVNLGNYHLRHEELAKATITFEAARNVAANELHDPFNTGQALRGLAFVAYRRKDFPTALQFAAEAQASSARIGDIPGEWQATGILAMALRATGKVAEARTSFARAIALIERQRGMVAGGEVEKQRYFEEAVYPFRELASLEAEAGNALAALTAAERARARVLLDVLAGGPEQVDLQLTTEERGEEVRLKASISTVNARMAKAGAAKAADLGKERDQAFANYETFLRGLYNRYPQLRTWRGDSPVVSEEDLARLVKAPDSAIIEFQSGQNELLEFVITAGKDPSSPNISVHRIPLSRADASRRAESYRGMLEARDPAYRVESRSLFNLLLGPAARELKGKTNIRLIPDGPLWGLPFQALTDSAGHYWIETASISWAHSITFLRDQAGSSLKRPPARQLLVLADPARREMARIPVLAEQARRVAGLYGAGNSVVLMGADANESSFKREAPGARILHIAAHGVVDSVNGLHSRLLLAPSSGAAGATEDGWLEAWELMQMRLSADLVVLSACETGRGRAAEGEGLLGLTWALFVSGAKAAVVSQWRVESESTSDLMVAFHQRLRRGERGDAALRGAVLALMKNPAYRHPMYWAPFIYSGQ